MALKSSVATWVENLSPTFLECRDLGHAWRAHTARWVADGRYYEQVIACPRCESQRVRYLSRGGVIQGGHHRYAKGYLMPKGLGGSTPDVRAALHLAALAPLLEQT